MIGRAWLGQWDVLLILFCTGITLIALLVRTIHWIFGATFVIRPSLERLLILIVLAALGVHTIMEHRPPEAQINRTIASAKIFYQDSWNPYLDNKVSVSLHQVIDDLGTSGMTTHALDTAQHELKRAIQATGPGDEVLAIDYGLDWTSTYSDYHNENLKACKDRNVAITRVFLLTKEVREGNVKFKDIDRNNLWDRMKEQSAAHCTVLVGKWEDLQKLFVTNTEYREFEKGLAIFRYQQASSGVAFLEVKPPYEIGAGQPYLLNVRWKPEEVKKWVSYFEWLSSPKNNVVTNLTNLKKEDLFPEVEK